jgi:hypothetical protein
MPQNTATQKWKVAGKKAAKGSSLVERQARAMPVRVGVIKVQPGSPAFRCAEAGMQSASGRISPIVVQPRPTGGMSDLAMADAVTASSRLRFSAHTSSKQSTNILQNYCQITKQNVLHEREVGNLVPSYAAAAGLPPISLCAKTQGKHSPKKGKASAFRCLRSPFDHIRRMHKVLAQLLSRGGGARANEADLRLESDCLLEIKARNMFDGEYPDKGWTANRGGWADLEQHRDASQCDGVTVRADGRIVGIVLRKSNLKGQVPASIGSLVVLERLDLFGNHISGNIPPEICSCVSLTNLNLGGNAFSGPIPPAIGACSKLHTLQLFTNQLSGTLPPSLGDMRGLAYLSLQENACTGPIPEGIGRLRGLKTLMLHENLLSGECCALPARQAHRGRRPGSPSQAATRSLCQPPRTPPLPRTRTRGSF